MTFKGLAFLYYINSIVPRFIHLFQFLLFLELICSFLLLNSQSFKYAFLPRSPGRRQRFRYRNTCCASIILRPLHQDARLTRWLLDSATAMSQQSLQRWRLWYHLYGAELLRRESGCDIRRSWISAFPGPRERCWNSSNDSNRLCIGSGGEVVKMRKKYYAKD